ncbi:MAG TPA: TetR/AcrR family transcriptional regulator C-terminal domain-containing protein [Candidatus Saccharimonadales bacterium]|nr:TetR/AcrR family transcriptional regulator C-terminal domain-containing protein [Candidatus Saccharimonadales bacterium]
MDNEKFARDMMRLEEARRRTEERMEQEKRRINRRFERLQQRLERKFGKPSDTQERIIEAALELLRQEGLANLTQRRLATMLNMQAPALYWHFKNKEVLVDHLAEAILAKEFSNMQPRADDESWQDWLVGHMVRLRKAMLAYKDGARVVAGAHLYPAVTLAHSLECGLVSLSSAGVDLRTARRIMVTATTYTFGYVIEEQSAPTAEEMAQFDLETFLVPYPCMAETLRDYTPDKQSGNDDYLAGLRYIIQGGTLQ